MAIDYSDWRAGEEERRSAIEPLLVGFEVLRRERPRDPTEAAFLRRIGTPERLVGPEAARPARSSFES